MPTSDAAYDTWEEYWARYIAYREPMPGMTVSTLTFQPPAVIRLLTADPRPAIIYPNSFSTASGRNASYEASTAVYDGYLPLVLARTSGSFNVGSSGGGFRISNAGVLTFATSGAGSVATPNYVTHAGLCLRNWQLNTDYLIGVAVLAANLSITGAGDIPTFPVNTLEFFLR